MPVPSVLIVGCGDVGGRLAQQLLALNWMVYGLRRQVSALPPGVLPVAGDLAQQACPAGWPQGHIDYVVYCVAASQHDEAGYQAAYVDGLKRVVGWLNYNRQTPQRLVFVSSSSVYAQSGGEWIDEYSVTEPTGFSGRLMLEAEEVARTSGWPATVVRLTGIYGPGRERLLEQVRQGYQVAHEPVMYGNRIHSDDAAGLLAHLVCEDAKGEPVASCYLGVDDKPAALAEVVEWLRVRLGVQGWAEESTVRRNGNKRCSNALARALGWEPRYPSYREGYEAILAAKP
ncbi:NAD-dependent epimerase/dehydratase [Pseudomonas sp. M47T1]|uniref:NAD-dependent epimerase/dehydratase family protein n=1 Tax=unclassified Pseudomonas TaxID=196821 RepID=UPI0002607851|nr:NAD-dependent epimerase/dehydratase family protein [Pseudomonas sp. M47T1]EIK97346.1 NAD-dependent epimerase/dehydratase [Pseudomonas sp. M47T1]